MTVVAAILWVAIVFGPVVAWALLRGPGYKRHPLEAPPPGSEWQASAERLLDPTTGAPIRVWYNRRSGERAYVADADGRG